MKLYIRKTTFDNLYKNILSINFAETWECLETNDNSVNPLVVFKTKKTNKLHKLIKQFVNKNRKESYDENTTKKDLIVGSLIGLMYQIEMEGK